MSSFPQLGILICIKKNPALQHCVAKSWYAHSWLLWRAGLVEEQVGSGNYIFVTFAQRFHLTGSTQPAFLCSDAPRNQPPFPALFL